MKLNPQKCSFGVSSGKFLGYIVSEKGIEASPDQIQAIRNMAEPKTSKDVMSLNGKVAALSRFISRATDKCVTFFDVIKMKKKFEWDEHCRKAFQELKDHLEKPPILSSPEEGEIFICIWQYRNMR